MDLFFARPDGTFLQFIYKPTFFQEKITWQNQKGESVNEYVPTLEPCGYSAYDVIHTIDIQQELLMSGVAGTQGPIYELKDSNHELLKAVYHGYREGYEEVENSSLSEEEKRSLNPTPLKTYEEYLSSHPLIFWRDPFGRVIRAVKKDYRPACMAEPIIYLYPQVKQVVDVAIDSPVNVIQSKPSYLIRPSTQIKETIVNTENTKRLPTWDLSDLYAGVDDPQLNADLTGMVAQGAAFEEKYKGRIACTDVTAELLRGALDAYEALLRAQYKPLAFASLLFSTDTTDARRGALLQRTREVGSAAATHLIFFDLEIGDMPQETFDR
ncbi:hypothetical protein HYR99_16510, partial [Candidatus Poribacteria bacterium]|nr:hypothetical protein [Candidatus Poribacteria bacterium]